MRYVLLTKASRHSEAGIHASQESRAALEMFLQELDTAGILLTYEMLYPSNNGLQLTFPDPNGQPAMKSGPLNNAQELIAGYTVIQVESEEEAIAWARRMPDPNGYGEGSIELRRIQDPVVNNSHALAYGMENELKNQLGL
ncbi:YciI family protein [Paenibacillus taichungensis]|uniref:YciI family protein n=1 Tax=Paenibacillus taichungensis TaxID=484184 RepID=UPI0039A51F59